MTIYDSGIRPAIDDYLAKEAAKERDYGSYWSASSAGYCMRKNIFERLKVPYVTEDARKQRIFSSGDIFHQWVQAITKKAGLSLAQELELQDEDLMIRGHFDDLIMIDDKLILYDIKTAHSKWFEFAKGRPMSYYNKMQLGTYMHMLRNSQLEMFEGWVNKLIPDLSEARILKISKDDLRLHEQQLLWSPELQAEVLTYWDGLNAAWDVYQQRDTLPPCTCADHENGFLATPKYNPYYFNNNPCSLDWYELKKKERALAK